MAGKIKTPIVDKNGKMTQVWKNPEGANEPVRSALIPIARASSKYSGHEVLAREPIVLGLGDEWTFGEDDGVGYDQDITSGNIYTNEGDEEGEIVYNATGYGVEVDSTRWLTDYVPAMESMNDQEKYDYVQNHADDIEAFLMREYKADEVEWTDDLVARPAWVMSSSEPISPDAVIDYWDTTEAITLYNESDPGTFNARNMWRVLGQELQSKDEIAELSHEEVFELTELAGGQSAEFDLRAIAFSGKIDGASGLRVVAQRQLIANSYAPSDAIAEVARNSGDESVQLLAVETDKLSDGELASIRSTTTFASVRDAVDDVHNSKIMDGFAS